MSLILGLQFVMLQHSRNGTDTPMEFQHLAEQKRYVLRFEGAEAYISYEDQDGVRVLDYSFVPVEFRGQKVGAELVRQTYELLIEQGVEAKATCSYLALLAKRNPEWQRFVP